MSNTPKSLIRTPTPQEVAAAELLVDRRHAVVGRLELLGLDELAVVAAVVDGLAVGRVPYGELVLATDKRDMRAEASQELRDALVYIAAELIKLTRRSQQSPGIGSMAAPSASR